MESLFFNAPTQRYQMVDLMRTSQAYLSRVDISNGIFFYEGHVSKRTYAIHMQNLDRMVMIVVVKQGKVRIEDHIQNSTFEVLEESVAIYGSSRQDFDLHISGKVFILCVADFFLKRYLSFDTTDPIDYVYQTIQAEHSLQEIATQPLDALSLYIIDKIIDTRAEHYMRSIRCMHRIIELIIYRFSLLDSLETQMDDEAFFIATKAKNHLLRSFKEPPTIEVLAHLCATNTSKLKKVFKEVHQTTIYGYIQKLRLEEANLLLREESLSIGEIANRVGYKHQGHFSKLFFSVYGIYPKDLKH